MDLYLLLLFIYNLSTLCIDPALQHLVNKFSPSFSQEILTSINLYPLNKYNTISSCSEDYNTIIFNNLLKRCKQSPSFHKKFIEIHHNITLFNSDEYTCCYKYLFNILKEFPPFSSNLQTIKEINTFQTLFLQSNFKKRTDLFSAWCTLTFPDFPTEDFLLHSINNCKNKIHALNNHSLKMIFNLLFLHQINPHTTPILVKIYQYLESNDLKQKNILLHQIAQSCCKKAFFRRQGKFFRSNFLQILNLANQNILLVHYQIPNTQHVVALTKKCSFTKQAIQELKELGGTAYLDDSNFAYIVFNTPLPSNIEPLTFSEIKLLKDVNSSIILTNENHLGVPFIYSPLLNGGIYIHTFIHNVPIMPLSLIIQKSQIFFDKIKSNLNINLLKT